MDEEVLKALKEADKALDKVKKDKDATGKASFSFEWPKDNPEMRISNFDEMPVPEIPQAEPFPDEIRISNFDEIPLPEQAKFPDSINIRKPAWLPMLFVPLRPIKELLEKINDKVQPIKWPSRDSEAIPVKITNHQSQAMFGGGGGISVPRVRSTANPALDAVPIVNPDGSNLSIEVDGIEVGTSFSDSDDTDKKGLVDADRHVQVDVVTSGLPTGAATSAKQDTGNTSLGTIAGAVSGAEMQVDVVSSALPTGAATAANQATANTALANIETAVEAIQAGQLADSHNVTVDNASGAAAVNIQDGGNTITVDGTVAVTNAGLTELAAAIDTEVQVDVVGALPAGDNNIGNVDIVSSALPTGASTSAKQDTIIGHVDGIEGLLTTIDADTGNIDTKLGTENTNSAAIKTAVEIIDNAISGSEMQVDVVAALPAGTNAIGKLAANSGVDIGDVDVTSIAAGTNSIGNVGLIPRTTGGMTPFKSIDIDETEEDVKTSAGQVFSISSFNHTAAPIYLKFYNATAANVSVGTTVPVLTFTVPGNADSDGAGFVWNNEIGFAFGTAICVAATTGIADNDTGAPAANACSVNIGYA